jgi:potassium-transporting ATPase KdpC subunit
VSAGPMPPAAPISAEWSSPPSVHVRAAVLVLMLTVVLGGIGYPLVITGFAQLATPGTANGSLITGPNGTIVGSALVGQNLSALWMFWERPSPVDFMMTLGTPTPPGPTDPALVNETRSYLAAYSNYTVNGTNYTLPGILSLWLVSTSGSGLDPDIPVVDALVQIPRIHFVTGLSNDSLIALVNSHITGPTYGLIGPSYVNVLELDIALETTLRI